MSARSPRRLGGSRRSRALLVTLFALALVSLEVGCAGRGGTIGSVLVQKSGGRLFLEDVPEGLGAAQAGLREGDEILLIEGRDVRELSPTEIHELLAGPVGETVRLTVVRGERVLRVAVARTPRAPRRAKP